jgi:hypothetical protein
MSTETVKAEMGEKPLAVLYDDGSWLSLPVEYKEGCNVYAAPPQTQIQAAIDKAREEVMEICDAIATQLSCEGRLHDYEPETAEEIKRRISALIGKPLGDTL